MCALKTLYFPGTAIYSAQQYPMFLLPGKMHILQPIENMPWAADQELVDTFIKNDFCQGYTPCPLGENRERFIHLVDDIRNRKDDYAAQLSHLTLAALSTSKKEKKESRGDIISALIGSHNLDTPAGLAAETEIWQARLVLKLAEILEKEEEELSQSLSILEDHEADVLQALQGEEDLEDEDNPFADLQQLKKSLISQGSGANKNRLRSWARLHQEEQKDVHAITHFITDNKDAAELLLDKYQDITGVPAAVMASFSIPALTGWDAAEVVPAICTFRHDNADILKTVEAVISGQELAETESLEKWNQAINHDFPEGKYGRKTVTVYSIEKYTCEDLLKKYPVKIEDKKGILIVLTD